MKNNRLLICLGSLLALAGIALIALVLVQKQIEGKIRTKLNQAIEQQADKADLSYRSVRVSLLKGRVDVNGITFTPHKDNPRNLSFTIDQMSVSDLDVDSVSALVMKPSQKVIPKSIRFSMTGAHFTSEILGKQGADFLQYFKYDEIKLSFSMGLKSNRDAKTLRFEDLNLEIADFGKISTTWDFSQLTFPTDDELNDPAKLKLKEAIIASALHYGEISYTDLGFMKRLDDWSKANGKPSLAQYSEMFGASMGRTPAKLSVIKDAIPKVQDFIKNGGRLSLRAKPAQDQPFVQLANPLNMLMPEKILADLGVSVEVSH